MNRFPVFSRTGRWKGLGPSPLLLAGPTFGTLVPTFAGVRNSRKVRYMVKLGKESTSRCRNLNIWDNMRLHAGSITEHKFSGKYQRPSFTSIVYVRTSHARVMEYLIFV